VSAAALKLEVVTPNSAVLERLETGEEVLEGATNVLDAPGQLQKGALVDDPRPQSDVIIGDRLAQDALYFPRAFGIRAEQRPVHAAADLVAALDGRVPAVGPRVVQALPQLVPGSTSEVLAALGERVPALTPERPPKNLELITSGNRLCHVMHLMARNHAIGGERDRHRRSRMATT
jgi:hypothetical protein